MNKNINRIFALVMALVMVFCMTACGGETASKTTEAPTETVSVCEANGHTWIDATCETPKTCAVCGETEGEALGHTWVDATYEAPKTCSVCGATEGEALVSYFAEYGLDTRLLDKSGEYELPAPCYDDPDKTTMAKITVESYDIFASDDTHEAMDGYEWRVITINARYDDENAQKYGMYGYYIVYGDYYENYDEGIEDVSENDAGTYTTIWNGVEYTECLAEIRHGNFSDWTKDENGNLYRETGSTITFRVPVGYDGRVVAVLPYVEDDSVYVGKQLHEIVTDTTLLFRLD